MTSEDDTRTVTPGPEGVPPMTDEDIEGIIGHFPLVFSLLKECRRRAPRAEPRTPASTSPEATRRIG